MIPPVHSTMPQRRTVLPDARRSPRFAGISTFCRYPLLDAVARENRPADWAIYGVPFDGGVTYRPGARFGPRAIRDASQYVKRFSIEHGLDLCESLSLADAGDAPIRPYSIKETLDAVAEFARGLGDSKTTKLLAVGGDHSIAYANMRATWERLGKPSGGLALIHFDSHLDTVDAVWGERWGHASVFIRAIEAGLVNPQQMLSIGMKGPLNAAADLDFARDEGVTLISAEQWHLGQKAGAGEVEAFVRGLGSTPAYITFDIDVVDPAYAPGTGTPSVGGFTSAEVFRILRSLAGLSLVGADVVEVLPDRDPAGITALLAAHVIFEILCLDAVRRKQK
jgi:agmatinase